MHIANSDKPVKFYSLDIVLAVGYRTNSSRVRTTIQLIKQGLQNSAIGVNEAKSFAQIISNYAKSWAFAIP